MLSITISNGVIIFKRFVRFFINVNDFSSYTSCSSVPCGFKGRRRNRSTTSRFLDSCDLMKNQVRLIKYKTFFSKGRGNNGLGESFLHANVEKVTKISIC